MFLFLTSCSKDPSALDKLKTKMDAGSTTTSNPPKKEGALERILREEKEGELEPFQLATPTASTSNTTIITIVNVEAPPTPTAQAEPLAPTPTPVVPKMPADLTIHDFRLVGIMGNFLVFQEKGGFYSEIRSIGQFVGNTGARITGFTTDNIGGAAVSMEKDGQSFILHSSGE